MRAAGLLDKRPAISAYGAALTEEQIAAEENAREQALEDAESHTESLEEADFGAEREDDEAPPEEDETSAAAEPGGRHRH